jgi:malonyl-CoA O-methyltransferase
MQDIALQKKQIKRCFNKAVENYEQAAVIQKIAVQHLLSKLKLIPHHPQYILDLGSGTGYGVRMLTDYYPLAKITGIDLAENMIDYASNIKTRAHYLCADFDSIPLNDNSVDLIFSSMALQWSLNLTATLSEWHRALMPKGLLLLSILSKNSLHELRTCFNNTCHVNAFMTNDEIRNKIQNNGFVIRDCEVKTHKILYKDFSSLLHSIKNVGANHVIRSPPQHILTKKSFLTAEKHYQQYAINGKLPITYELCYIVAEVKK